MRCLIDSRAIDGLKIIEEIPDISPCMLEGSNGIGKTVAIQLLELISGSIPDDFRRRPVLWSSLRERIGATTINIDHLRDDHSLSVTFTPKRWDSTLPDAVGEWLGTATLDGRPGTIGACTNLLSVTRIAGDEDLEVTLRKRVETLSAYLRSVSEIVRKRGSAIENHLKDILPDLQRADPVDIERDTALLGTAEQEFNDAKEKANIADHRLRNLLRALETKRRLEAAGQAADVLLARRDELVHSIKGLESELKEKEKAAKVAGDNYSAEGDAQKKLAAAQRLLRNRLARLANLERETRRLATELSISVSSTDINRAYTECSKNLERLTERYRLFDKTALVRDLIDEITLPLKTAESQAGDQTLVRTVEGGLTVSQTLAGVGVRRQEIADQPQPAQLRDLTSEIEAAKQRLNVLAILSEKLQQQEAAEGRVAEAEEDVDAATRQAEYASEAARLLREAHQAVGAVQKTLTQAHAELAAVQQQIGATGATSKEDAEKDLGTALSELGLTVTELEDAEGAARRALAAADNTAGELAASVSAIRRRLTVHKTDVDLVIGRLQDEKRFSWLIQATPDLNALLTDPSSRYETFRILRETVLRVGESAYESADLLDGLVGIADGFFANSVERPDGSPGLVQILRPGFEKVLGERLRETLDRPSIRNALFDGADLVGVEPGTRQLTLRDAEGNESHRPMEAFSSGERAFAFTQARIVDLISPNKPNRLLVLDEFGAYVAADRLPDLATFLATEIEDVADQVVVILPLHVDYKSEISDTRGELRARYEDRLAQIEERGYCAVMLT
jgi:hypothetical protein